MNFTYESPRLIMKVLNSDNASDVLSFLIKNKDEFERYEAKKTTNYYTLSYQKNNLKAELSAFRQLKYIRFYVFKKGNEDQIIGTISFSNILPYPYLSASIGYKFDSDFRHLGYASESIMYAISVVFNELKLHRIEAFVMPQNSSSINLLEKIGFHNEGLCKKSISICGKFEDHLRYAIINE